jgi:hypothetical protein
MNARYYLRAYLAGIAIPTAFLVVFITGFTVARYVWHVPGPAERFIVFPMAVLPNLWGTWNMLHAWMRRRFHVSLGAFGATLPVVAAPVGFLISRVVGVEFPAFMIRVFPAAFVVVVIVYYLLWKHAVQYLNDLVEEV